jgi:hypothetical protein
MTRKTFVDGDRWFAADAQLVMDQCVLFFSDAAQRDAQIPTPTAGMVAFLSATNSLWVYRSGSWTEVLSTNGTSSMSASVWPLADVLGADTTAPVLGNAVVASYYAKAGAVHRATLRILFGSGTTFGTGAWWVKLPAIAGSVSYHYGHGYYNFSTSAATILPVTMARLDNTRARLITPVGGFLQSTAGAWGAGGSLNLQFDYF